MPSRLTIDDINWCCGLSEPLKQKLVDIAQPLSGLDAVIPRAGFTTLDGVYYFASGLFTLCFCQTNGDNLVGSIHGSGDWLGAMTVGDQMKFFMLSEEIEPVEVFYFPGAAILAIAENDPHVYRWLYHTAKGTKRLWARANMVAQHDMTTRVAYVLLELASRNLNPDSTTLRIRISQQKLADISGTSRPRLNEVLKTLEQQHVLQLGRGYVDIVAIEALATQLHSLNSMFQVPENAPWLPKTVSF